jgi:hypothetical protein
MDIIYHYPPELFQILIDTIPLLCKSKKDVILFFKGAGVAEKIISDLIHKVEIDRSSISKYEIVRTTLQRLNEKGEASLRERREILKRVTEYEDFSSCWPTDQLKAKGLVAEVRRITNVKDSFTRMKIEKEKEQKKHIAEKNVIIKKIQKKNEEIEKIKKDFFSLFPMENPQERGRQLEKVLNRLFKAYDILVRESFSRKEEECSGIIEQIDGVIELDSEIYLVEIKWTHEPVNVDQVSRHLVRIYHRGSTRGIFISASGYTDAAIKTCKEALQKTVIVLCDLYDFVKLLDNRNDLKIWLREKIHVAMIDKNPYKVN